MYQVILLPPSCALNKEAAGSTETSVQFYQDTGHHMSYDTNLQPLFEAGEAALAFVTVVDDMYNI
jgi:hypothetical protein